MANAKTIGVTDRFMLRRWMVILLVTLCTLFIHARADAQTGVPTDLRVPTISPSYPISVTSDRASVREQGSYVVYELTGNCQIHQGPLKTYSQQAILWIDKKSVDQAESPIKTICYLDGQIELKWEDGNRIRDVHWSGRLYSKTPVNIQSQTWLEQSEHDQYKLKDTGYPSEPLSELEAYELGFAGPNGPKLSAKGFRPHQREHAGTNRLAANAGFTQHASPMSDSPVQPAQFQSNQLAPPITAEPKNSGGLLPPPTSPREFAETISPSELITPPRNQTSIPGFQTPGGIIPQQQFQIQGNGQVQSTSDPSNFPQNGIEITSDGQIVAPQIESVPTELAPQTITSQQIGNPLGIGNETGLSARSFRISGRTSSAADIQFQSGGPSGESIATVTRGVRIEIGGVTAVASNGAVTQLGKIFIEADRAVIWTRNFTALVANGVDQEPLEMYLEGNIYFKQGRREVFADRMYYNASSDFGMILNAEMLTPVPQYEGLLRLKADVVQQRSQENFLAFNAAVTSSRLGVPRYWLQSGNLELQDQRRDAIDPATGLTIPTALAAGGTGMEITARNNKVYLAGLPVLYWPVLNTNLQRPSFYLTGLEIKSDNIFGNQVFANWDLFQILGIDAPEGTDWTLSTDFLSERGPALGTTFSYDTNQFLVPGPTAGFLDAWFIDDEGLDVLGSDRIDLQPEARTRGRILGRHRQIFSDNLELFGEVGFITDRNFLEQYFEREWDQEKDLTTGLRLRRYNGNRLFDIFTTARLNDFFTETQWLPRADHYWLGQDLLNERLTWYAKSTIGFADQQVASTPEDPIDAANFQLQPFEVAASGLRATTRQELNLPLNFRYGKIVPYLGGEAAFFEEDVNGDSVTRLTGQAGIRSSVPLAAYYPEFQSRLFNINGLAHKVKFTSETFYADTSVDFNQLPLFDPLDDNSQEHFRRRFVFNTFGGALPDQFDPRSFAIRQGLQRYVTASSTEVVDDQLQSRIGINQRWQTKRGRPGSERITDLVELDADLIFFPDADRDNFGESIGAINYDFRYNIGDRFAILSDGYFDVFDQGLRAVTLGTILSRPGRGELYFGGTSLEGPISSFVISSTFNYRLNDKFIASGGLLVDIGEAGSIGQNLSITRIGESFLVRVGVNIDRGRDNASVQFAIEPRFLPTSTLRVIGGQAIPPAGLFGLE